MSLPSRCLKDEGATRCLEEMEQLQLFVRAAGWQTSLVSLSHDVSGVPARSS